MVLRWIMITEIGVVMILLKTDAIADIMLKD